ncbi:hypothetical protein FIBSPDRAFT_760078, partial [Athelia psychrophila]
CSICLQPLVDRTVIPTSAHESCFECIMVWTEQSRKCPLCAQPIREHLIHHLRARYDYQKHYLAPLRSRSPNQLLPLASSGNNNGRSNTNTGRDRAWGRRARMAAEERQVADALEREIAKPKWVYEHRLFAKHVASNPYTRYRPAPVPAAFAANPVFVARATAFLRRELCVWDDHRRRVTHHLRCQSDEGGGRAERGGRAAARGVPQRGRAGGGGVLRA